MNDTDSTVGCVDTLATSAPGSVCIDAQILLVNVDVQLYAKMVDCF